MEDSIFESIKSLLGPDASYDVFDQDILIHINTAIAVLAQLGVGSSSGFVVTGPEETWRDFLGDDKILQMAKTYISPLWADAIVFAVLVLVLVVRPTGLLGKEIQEKV